MLSGKNILLGITGGIAAYKTAFLVRLLIKAGATVRVIMTESAADFVTPLTLATLSKNPVFTAFIKEEEGKVAWNNHVEMGMWADLMLIAPATANTLSKMADGKADNLLLACYLSAKCPVFFAPAMDLDMYRHPAAKASFEKLQSYGNTMIPADTGELASGLTGEGRMAEPEAIVAFLRDHLSRGLPLSGKKVVITTGPTYEAIDPVRFIGNHSSGLMGFELAEAAVRQGARVVLIAGPGNFSAGTTDITLNKVTSAAQMDSAVQEEYGDADIVICAAAVSDFRPKEVAAHKIKKVRESITLELVQNRDILLALGEAKQQQYLVGFALETENEIENATLKLKRKNLDAIVLNSMNDPGAGFGSPTNKITFIDKNLEIIAFELKTKKEVAEDILHEIIKRVHS